MSKDLEAIFSHEKWGVLLRTIRQLLSSTELVETYKWKQACYTFGGKNVLIIGALKNHCTMGFFKGALLQDQDGLLEPPGPNSEHVRVIRLSNEKQLTSQHDTILALVQQAIELEKQGAKVDKSDAKQVEQAPELIEAFASDPEFQACFEALTPGRQRGYHIFFTQAKSSAARQRRIDKYHSRIMKGYGMNDCVCGLSNRMPNCDGSHKHAR